MKVFAGDENNKDACHVGSALFLGNSIQLMCSKHCHRFDQYISYRQVVDKQITSTNKNDWVGDSYVWHEIDRSKYSWTDIPNSGGNKKQGEPRPNREDWIVANNPDISLNLFGNGFKRKFQYYKDNVWMSSVVQQTSTSSRNATYSYSGDASRGA